MLLASHISAPKMTRAVEANDLSASPATFDQEPGSMHTPEDGEGVNLDALGSRDLQGHADAPGHSLMHCSV